MRERTAQLLQSEKLAEMGGLLAGVVDEINNPLTVALGQASLLRHALGADPLAARAARIEEAVGRAVSGIEPLVERLEREVERVLPWLDPALWLPPK